MVEETKNNSITAFIYSQLPFAYHSGYNIMKCQLAAFTPPPTIYWGHAPSYVNITAFESLEVWSVLGYYCSDTRQARNYISRGVISNHIIMSPIRNTQFEIMSISEIILWKTTV